MARISTANLRKKHQTGDKIVMLTCYDASFARLVQAADVDILLIGDSLGMVIQGYDTTVPVTLDEVIYHCRAVARGCDRPHLVGDLPFGSYQLGPDQAVTSGARLLKEGAVQSVKLEGGEIVAESVFRMTQAGIPVMGHLGLTPQSVHQFGGYKIQGRTQSAAEKLISDAKILEEAGCYSVVLEGIPAPLAAQVTESIGIPTIGIAAGPHCSGQVLVLYDLLGMDERFNPKFVKKYDNFSARVIDAVGRYATEVRAGEYPSEEYSHQK